MNKLKRYFISGLIIFLPLAMTIYLLVLTFNFADGILGKYIEPYFSREFGFYFRGFSIVICVALILFIGFLASNFIGHKLFPFFEGMILRLPFFKQVYPAIKEIAIFIFSREKLTLRQVVLVEWPRKGVYALGFLTNEVPKKIADIAHQDLCYVYIAKTPSPLSGYLVLIPKKELIFPDLTAEEALKILVTGGVMKS
jgi:uncharacterized membrane protein